MSLTFLRSTGAKLSIDLTPQLINWSATFCANSPGVAIIPIATLNLLQ